MLIQNMVSASGLCQINSCQENLLKIVLSILLEIERNGGISFVYGVEVTDLGALGSVITNVCW